MKVAYDFAMPRAASYKLAQMILPQLEVGTHGVDVAGMFFFDDNNFVPRKGDPIGERLAKVAAEKGMLLMMCDMCDMCDMCALERNLAEGEPRWCAPDGTGRTAPGEIRTVDTVEGGQVGCFPDLYAALSGSPTDQAITL
ncbi:MAG TPA: sulfur reduction protein DsrE [candidate division Zixibacteria bacterium]|nr:sulfur reduction protein DsrE [candidate division Zixibacteria bacterium]